MCYGRKVKEGASALAFTCGSDAPQVNERQSGRSKLANASNNKTNTADEVLHISATAKPDALDER
jgi:hypothetical protein